jgi:hypothetical protein
LIVLRAAEGNSFTAGMGKDQASDVEVIRTLLHPWREYAAVPAPTTRSHACGHEKDQGISESPSPRAEQKAAAAFASNAPVRR